MGMGIFFKSEIRLPEYFFYSILLTVYFCIFKHKKKTSIEKDMKRRKIYCDYLSFHKKRIFYSFKENGMKCKNWKTRQIILLLKYLGC